MNIRQVWKVPKPKGTEKSYAFKKIRVLREEEGDKVFVENGVVTLSDVALARFKRVKVMDIYKDTHDKKNIALVRCPQGNFAIENGEVLSKGLADDGCCQDGTYQFKENWHGFFVYRKCE